MGNSTYIYISCQNFKLKLKLTESFKIHQAAENVRTLGTFGLESNIGHLPPYRLSRIYFPCTTHLISHLTTLVWSLAGVRHEDLHALYAGLICGVCLYICIWWSKIKSHKYWNNNKITAKSKKQGAMSDRQRANMRRPVCECERVVTWKRGAKDRWGELERSITSLRVWMWMWYVWFALLLCLKLFYRISSMRWFRWWWPEQRRAL